MAALASGRVVLAALAVPFVVIPLLMGGAAGAIRVSTSVDRPRVNERDLVTVTVTLAADVDLDAVVVTLGGAGFDPVGHDGTLVTAVIGGRSVSVEMTFRALRWGRHQLGPGTVRYATAALVRRGEVDVPAVTVDVLTGTTPYSSRAGVPRARAYAGAHRSRAVGEGAEFAGVRPYTAGDPPRRINWRATARTGDLSVTQTYTDRAADVVVVLDAVHDTGPRGRSSIDVAVRAATGVVEHHLALGDSVGLLEYGGHQRMLAPGTGRAQLARARDWLLDTRSVVTAAVRAVRWPAAFAGRAPLTIVLTPLVDEASTTLLAELRLLGAAVLAIDTLPPDALPRPETLRDQLARRLWRLQRDLDIARLADIGVPVAAWGGTGEVEPLLADLVRMATAPRVSLR